VRWSFRIFKLAGIDIEMHVGFPIMVAWFALSQANSRDALVTVAELLLMFGCVLLHELGHALAARRFGIATRKIVLLPFGGVAQLERMPEKPTQELIVALAGPGVNVILATGLAAFLLIRGVTPEQAFARAEQGLPEFLLLGNLVMLLFNLVPAFPMDGGRVLRSLLAMRLPYARATRIAAQIGQASPCCSRWRACSSYAGPLMVFVALFVFMSAGEERALVATRTALSGLPVSAAMVTAFMSLETRHELQYAADLMLAGDQQDFPVLEGGRYLGMLARKDLIKGLREEGPTAPVGRVGFTDLEPVDAGLAARARVAGHEGERALGDPVVVAGPARGPAHAREHERAAHGAGGPPASRGGFA